MSGIEEIEFVFLLLLLFIVVLGLLARRLTTPYPIVMVIGGLLLSVIPGMPAVQLDPQLIFLIILPPLFYAAAWTTSWRDFRYNLVSIAFLAFGLVGFTVIAVGFVAPRLLDGFDSRLALVLGAVVAPTDTVAANAIARRVGLPRGITDILEGESLINDATGLLALQFATAIVVSNVVPGPASGLVTFLWLTGGGIGIGLLAGWIVDRIERHIDDAPIEITLSILVPYGVYVAAEKLHTSGVLAVVCCGLLLARGSARFFSPQVRIQIWSFWESLTFVLNGLVFVLIGLQLPAIQSSIRGYSSLTPLLIEGALFSAFVILLRLIWVFPGAVIAWFVRTRIGGQHQRPPRLRPTFIIGWTGMRGVVSLAAALALPAVVADGSPFPQRNLIVFLTFCVIFVTLVLQGVTLPPLIRALGLAGAAGPNCEEQEARQIVLEAAVSHLKHAKQADSEDSAAIYDDLIHHYEQRLQRLHPSNVNQRGTGEPERYLELSLESLRVERETAIRLRDEGRINDEVLRHLERELDLSESQIS